MKTGFFDNKKWDDVRNVVLPFPLNESNVPEIEDIPHSKNGDIVVVFGTIAEFPSGDLNLISNENLALWGISDDDLLARALENVNRVEPNMASLEHKVEHLISGNEDDDDESFHNLINRGLDRNGTYVLSTKPMVYGAMMLTNETVLKEISRSMRDSFYIIPSSIHELLIIGSELTDPQDLQQMLIDVNRTAVKQSDKLSDRLMMYDVDSKTVLMVNSDSIKEMEERKNEADELAMLLNDIFDDLL